MSEPTMQALTRRVEQLERDNRRWRRGVALGLLLLGSAGLLGQAPIVPGAAKAIDAERFNLRDGAGHLRGSLGVTSDGTASLILYNTAGAHQAGLGVLPDGTAIAPDDAPEPVKRVIQAGNAIAKFPYKWGGGHGAWRDNGYDCSGSVSFALAGAGLLKAPMTSGGFVDWGASGPGEWITIYANAGHIFMIVAGLRFDTSGQGRAGTRWQEEPRSTDGFAVRSVPGL